MLASAAPRIVVDDDPPLADPDAPPLLLPPPPLPAVLLPLGAEAGRMSVEYKGFLDRDPRKNSCVRIGFARGHVKFQECNHHICNDIFLNPEPIYYFT